MTVLDSPAPSEPPSGVVFREDRRCELSQCLRGDKPASNRRVARKIEKQKTTPSPRDCQKCQKSGECRGRRNSRDGLEKLTLSFEPGGRYYE